MAHRLAARQVIRSVSAAVVVGVALVAAAPSQAAFPGANGKIAYGRGDGIYSINPDGSGSTKLTDYYCCGVGDFDPAWSPDGTKIAFGRSPEVDFGEIWVMNADGSEQTYVSPGFSNVFDPAWSPDGSKLVVYGYTTTYDPGLYVLNADGSGPVKIPNTGVDERFPTWSPDGSRIAFVTGGLGGDDIYTIKPDGSNRTRLTSDAGHDNFPSWSPDGSRIAFKRDSQPCGPTFCDEVWVMNSDGSGQARLIDDRVYVVGVAWSPDGAKIAFDDYGINVMNADGSGRTVLVSSYVSLPDWQPLPTASYAHPQSAPSLQASLVPTFRPCGTGANPTNGQHSPPLGTQACLPPVPGSNVARVGASSVGSASFTVVPGDTDATNGDQADVSLTASLTDVKTPAGADYTPNPTGPDLTEITRLRLTDKANNYGGASGTATEYDFRVPLECTATADPALGSSCSSSTSADALLPGFVTEQRQTVVQAFRVRVDDAGANGTTGDSDDRIFATQGIYVP